MEEETIVEKDKIMQNKRICLVGIVAENNDAKDAANKFNVPIVTSETGEEFINDKQWTTYFILSQFDTPEFDRINKSEIKHRIMGIQALITAAESNPDELPTNNRPVYNYSMKGVFTAFTGIRARDELTHLVRLIHYMGGSIRKEMNHKATHLVSSAAFGEKYRYALTFRLNVIRTSWIVDAWKNRDVPNFSAKDEAFTAEHRLKIFEGCRIAFIGFPENEKQNMVELLRSYNGVETTSDDETCTHKIIADCPIFLNENNDNTTIAQHNDEEGFDQFEDSDYEEANDTVDFASQVILRKHESFLKHCEQNERDGKNLPIVMEEDELTRSSNRMESSKDGAILRDEETDFDNAVEISPIPRSTEVSIYESASTASANREAIKRKRAVEIDESVDNISMMSVNESSKKIKLSRAGSISKTFKRRMSFTQMVTPIKTMLRSRRNSVDQNISSSSTATFNSTFNDSIKEPIKEKFRQMKDKVCKLTTPKSSKSKMKFASANMSKMQDICTVKSPDKSILDGPSDIFKTPKAPSTRARCRLDDSIRHFDGLNDTFNATLNVTVNEKKLVIDENSVRYDHDQNIDDPKYAVVKAEWFWTRIAEGYAPEDDFLYKDYIQSVKNVQAEQCERRDSLINYSAKTQRKRKRLSRIVLEGTPSSAGKRRSSISDAGILSESLIDYTPSPDKNESVKTIGEEISITSEQPSKKFSMRHNHFMDFYHTESNYVGILETIVKLFKLPLEKMAEENADQVDLLNTTELKSIFGNFLPIYEVHKKMLNRLQEINSQWHEDCAIGQIILDNRESLLKAYPPYVNFFEQMKNSLTQSAKAKPRFQAFLKINQAKPECGRQTLQELMIRPVQRLPSISLLLNDILKHTPKNCQDHHLLEESLTAIKEVMTYINEDKRKTEGQKQMFDIFNEIENCPAQLISSHRSFVSRCEVTELTDTLSGRGDPLTLFLFTDTLLICKRRSKYNQNSKSPNSIIRNNIKPFKYIRLIPLTSIRTLADISDSPRAFAISLRSTTNIQDISKDKLYSFSISDEEIDKTIYIKNFSKQLAENACRADAEKFVVSVHSQDVGIEINEIPLGTLSKAFRLATRTRLKVGRAFSFNKTPSRGGERKRNVQSPISKATSNVSLTPSTISSMSHLKLHSSLSLASNEYDMERKEIIDTMPLTDQMSRRNVKGLYE